MRVSEVNRILGTALTGDDLPGLLDAIGFTVSGAGDLREVDIPSWRPDSAEEIDVIEEIARMYGYDRVGMVVPASPVHGHLSLVQQRRRRLRDVLLGLGITEAMPNPFLARNATLAPVSTGTHCGSATRSSPRRACCGPRCGLAC